MGEAQRMQSFPWGRWWGGVQVQWSDQRVQKLGTAASSPGCLQPGTILPTETSYRYLLRRQANPSPCAVHTRHDEVPSSSGRCHSRGVHTPPDPSFSLHACHFFSVCPFFLPSLPLDRVPDPKLHTGSRITANSYKTSSDFHMSVMGLPPNKY